jgi:regulator of RNase E activity RraA
MEPSGGRSLSRACAMLAVTALVVPLHALTAQQSSKDELVFLTPEWNGERFADGRPRVPDDILERMRHVTLEEAWAVLRGQGFEFQYEGDWQVIDPDAVLVGRAVTATFVPGRPDIHKRFDERGRADGRSGSQNSWPVDMLQPGDVYVADQFAAHVDGPTVGDNVGNAIHANSGNGFVYNGAVRDLNGLKQIEGLAVFFRSYHPSHHNPPGRLNTTLVGINTPTRIGAATVMPGDVVLGRDGGVIFIPPQLAQRVVETSEIVRLRDLFGQQRLAAGVYTSGQIDARWSDDIERDFSRWLEANVGDLPVPRERIEELLRTRTW